MSTNHAKRRDVVKPERQRPVVVTMIAASWFVDFDELDTCVSSATFRIKSYVFVQVCVLRSGGTWTLWMKFSSRK